MAFLARLGAALFLATTLGLMALELVASYTQAGQDAEREASGLSELLAQRLTSGMMESDHVLENLGENDLVQTLLKGEEMSPAAREKLTQSLQHKLHRLPFLSQLQILDTTCRLVYSSDGKQGEYLSRADFCRWLHRSSERTDSSFTSVQRSGQESGIISASKLFDESGKLTGLATAVIQPAYFQTEVSKITAEQHGEIAVFDRGLNLIARWPKIRQRPDALTGDTRPVQMLMHGDNHDLYTTTSPVDGLQRLYSARPLSGYPLHVAVGLSTDDIRRPVQEKAMAYLLAWLVLAAVTLVALRSHLNNLRHNVLLQENARQIRENEQQARLALDTAPTALLLVGHADMRILYANAPARTMLQLPDELDGNDAGTLADSEMRLPLRIKPLTHWLISGEEARDREVELELENGSRLWVIASMELTRYRDQIATLIGLYDISTRKALEQQLEEKSRELNEMAITDPLTRLYNRRHSDQALRDEINRCARYGQPMALALFDIDHFKQFNDQYGHQAGDNVLIAVANELRDSTRATDVCARIGGEEFLVLFPCTRMRDASKVMERLRSKLAETVYPFADTSVTISGGLTDWRPDDTPKDMLARADRLLYLAKDSGRNRFLEDVASPEQG